MPSPQPSGSSISRPPSRFRFASSEELSGQLPSSLVLLGALLAGVASVALFDGTDEGWVLLGAAVVEGLAAAALFPRARQRDLSAFLGAVALGLGGVAVAIILSGPALTVAWAAEAAVLAWLARRANELKYQVVALAYLTGAFVHAIFWEAPLDQLYTVTDSPADGVVAVIALALGRRSSRSTPSRGTRTSDSAASSRWLRRCSWPSAARSPSGDRSRAGPRPWPRCTQLRSESSSSPSGSLPTIPRPSTGATSASRASGALLRSSCSSSGTGARRFEIRLAGIAWLGAVLLEAVLFDLQLDGDPRGYAVLVAGAALGIGALVDRLAVAEAPAFPVVAGFVLASIGLAVGGVVLLTTGDWENYWLLGVAALYAAVGVVVHRRDRDLSTVLWSPALVVAAWAASELLSGTWLTLVWAATAAALVALAARTGERRLEIASLAFLGLALLHTLGIDAPVEDLFEANAHPEDGVPALLLTIGAALAFGHFSRHEQRKIIVCRIGSARHLCGLARDPRPGGENRRRECRDRLPAGHSGVSAFWGVIGLVALYVGLQRELRWLRLSGLGLFGLALAKLFLYDLAFLSSITRALSFLAVGAVLLLGGFFMQAPRREPRQRRLAS